MNRGGPRERSQRGAGRLELRWRNAGAAPRPPRATAPRWRSVPEARPGASEFRTGPLRASAASQSPNEREEKTIAAARPRPDKKKPAVRKSRSLEDVYAFLF